MILKRSDLEKLTRGAVRIEEDNGIFSFFRFGEGGLAHYRTRTPQYLKKALASASVVIDFLSDASVLSFDFSVSEGSSREYYYFDIYVDGILVEHMGESKMWLKTGHVHVDLTKYPYGCDGYAPVGSLRRVSVYLPNLANTKISNITLEGATQTLPAPSKLNMIAYGDSITQGYDAEFPSLSYVNRVARHFDARLINQGVGGEHFIPDIIEEVSFAPDIITVSYGTNDWSTGNFELFKQNCEEFFKKLRFVYPTALIFAILPIWRADGEKTAKKVGKPLDFARDFIEQTAEKYGCHVINGRGAVPHHPQFYYDSRVHPNDLGFAEYANAVIRGIEAVMQEQNKTNIAKGE